MTKDLPIAEDYGEDYLDEIYSVYTPSYSAYLSAAKDCLRFIRENSDLLDQANYPRADYTVAELMGGDFLLNRNGIREAFIDREIGANGVILASAVRENYQPVKITHISENNVVSNTAG